MRKLITELGASENRMQEGHRILIMSALLGICGFLIFYFHSVLERGTIFTHFFYIPIILASLWWKRKGLVVAIFLAAILIVSHIFFRLDVETANDYLRAFMFIVIAFVVASLSEQIGKVEKALRRASAYNRSLIEANLDLFVTIDPEGKITDVNTATEVIIGCSREELIGTDFSEYFTDPGKARAGYQQVFQEGVVQDYALEIRSRDGDITPVLYNAPVYRDEAGDVIGVFAAARDITERRQAEQELARSNAELQKTVNLMAGREVRMAELKDVILKLRAQVESAGMTPVADDPLKEI